MKRIKITGLGSCIPSVLKKNEDFISHDFLDETGEGLPSENTVIVEKFKQITGIEERRYAKADFTSSDLGFIAAEKAIADASIDKETIDYIIVAHNFGDVKPQAIQSDILPSLATRIKHKLQIKNPNCVAYDVLFGCPGWIEGMIQAKMFIESGNAKNCLVIGTETLSRVVDIHDRDSMIYSDGAGASVLSLVEEDTAVGILSHTTQTYTFEEAYYLYFGKSYNATLDNDVRYIKMNGRKIYEFALNNVPQAMKIALDKAGVSIDNLSKILIHQANEKMDEAIIKRFFRLYKKPVPEGIMPMSIHKLGNSSVATVPTLFDLIKRGELEGHQIDKGDIILLASVGSGMNINAIVYQY